LAPHDAGVFTGFEDFDFVLHCVSPIFSCFELRKIKRLLYRSLEIPYAEKLTNGDVRGLCNPIAYCRPNPLQAGRIGRIHCSLKAPARHVRQPFPANSSACAPKRGSLAIPTELAPGSRPCLWPCCVQASWPSTPYSIWAPSCTSGSNARSSHRRRSPPPVGGT